MLFLVYVAGLLELQSEAEYLHLDWEVDLVWPIYCWSK